MKYLILISLLLTCVYANYWSFFVFNQSWPSSVYNKNNSYFVINNIQPYIINDNNSFTYCNVSKFNINSLDKLLTNLSKYWTNYDNYTEFIEHIYYKYYSCINNNIFNNSYIYFKYGLDLYSQFNLYNILASHNITPSGNKYHLSSLEFSIFYTINVFPIVYCNNKSEVSYVGICFDTNIKPINCPGYIYKNKCQNNYVIYNI